MKNLGRTVSRKILGWSYRAEIDESGPFSGNHLLGKVN